MSRSQNQDSAFVVLRRECQLDIHVGFSFVLDGVSAAVAQLKIKNSTMAKRRTCLWYCCASTKTEKCEKSSRNEEESFICENTTDASDSEGNVRNKVALLPGYSLMDWIRLGNSGADLSGVGGAFLEVTEEELATHNTQDNAWISIRGKVYNATPYMGFHPGGIPELMKGAGKDATKLFTEIHPWVNYESILRKCLVGRLVRSKSAATPADFEKSFLENVKLSEAPDFDAGCRDESVFDSDIKMNWCQTLGTVRFVFQCRVSSPHIVVTLRPEYQLRILIRVKKKLHVFGFKLEKKVYWPCSVSMNTDTGRLEVELTKKEEGLWNNYGVNDKDHAMVAASVDDIETYHQVKIVSITQATHNVRIFVFKFVEKVMMWVPLGHDIRIRAMIEGVDCAKQYTPIPPYLPHCEQTVKHWHQDYICCMVKYYPEGALTPYLFAKQERDVVEIGGMGGSFNIRRLSQAKELYLIAAGSGLSPMLRLMVWAVSKKDQLKSMNLLFVNRHEEDIIWRKELNELSRKEKWFKVRYCLSQPGPHWKGLKGRLDKNMLDEFLPDREVHSDELPQFYVCACGPIEFTEMIQKYLTDRGYDSWSHCFIG